MANVSLCAVMADACTTLRNAEISRELKAAGLTGAFHRLMPALTHITSVTLASLLILANISTMSRKYTRAFSDKRAGSAH